MLDRSPLERARKAGELARGIVTLRGRSRGPHSAPRLGSRGIRGVTVSFTDALHAISESDAEVLVVGMMAAVLQGAPLVTFGIDLLHRDTPQNESKVAALLERLGAALVLATETESEVAEGADADAEADAATTSPPIDVVSHRSLADGLTYEELLGESTNVALGEGRSVRVLSLEQVIVLKKRQARPKDRAALPALEATLEEIRSRSV